MGCICMYISGNRDFGKVEFGCISGGWVHDRDMIDTKGQIEHQLQSNHILECGKTYD